MQKCAGWSTCLLFPQSRHFLLLHAMQLRIRRLLVFLGESRRHAMVSNLRSRVSARDCTTYFPHFPGSHLTPFLCLSTPSKTDDDREGVSQARGNLQPHMQQGQWGQTRTKQNVQVHALMVGSASLGSALSSQQARIQLRAIAERASACGIQCMQSEEPPTLQHGRVRWAPPLGDYAH